ncbi:hypothetical protein PR048_028324 [Dryococelus australis]|uniref:Reverse transcriptase domain-containing protein n=1 Tax=Dryococelus australis TaxID=614101 RepID=A0ABQ9GJ07_9NEOP|nr:hypothetical protein PR048_028324 [Dryococelus australis]
MAFRTNFASIIGLSSKRDFATCCEQSSTETHFVDLKLNFTDYRPITLLYTDYNILAGLFADRLKHVLSDIIGPEQYCAVRNTSIIQGVAVLRDVQFIVKSTPGPAYLLNIDLDKAFDRENWNLLDRILLHVGFPRTTIAILQTLRRDATTQINLNGRLGESFAIQSSVRQGCPLTMSQFVLYIEPLLRTLHSKLYYGISVGTRTLTCIRYVDDVTYIVRSEDDVDRINETLSAFTRAAIAQVISAKTKLLDLKPEPHSLRQVSPYVTTDPLRTLGIEFMQNSG